MKVLLLTLSLLSSSALGATVSCKNGKCNIKASATVKHKVASQAKSYIVSTSSASQTPLFVPCSTKSSISSSLSTGVVESGSWVLDCSASASSSSSSSCTSCGSTSTATCAPIFTFYDVKNKLTESELQQVQEALNNFNSTNPNVTYVDTCDNCTKSIFTYTKSKYCINNPWTVKTCLSNTSSIPGCNIPYTIINEKCFLKTYESIKNDAIYFYNPDMMYESNYLVQKDSCASCAAASSSDSCCDYLNDECGPSVIIGDVTRADGLTLIEARANEVIIARQEPTGINGTLNYTSIHDQVPTEDTDFATDMLSAINDLRSEHNASNLNWDVNLANAALQSAKLCSCDLTPVGDVNGQLIAMGVDGPEALKLWLASVNGTGSEVMTDPPTNIETYGWLSQLVWKNTTSVGCAVAQCNKCCLNSTSLVCQFSPIGNVEGYFQEYFSPA